MSFRNTGYDEEAASKAPAFQLLDEGDYPFSIIECIGLLVTDGLADMVQLKLSVEGNTIFDNRCAGVSSKGQDYDMISPFLKAIDERPGPKEVGSDKYWSSLKGKKGTCHVIQHEIEQGKLAGKMGNKVSYYLIPRTGAPLPTTPKQTPPARRQVPHDPDLDTAADDIPF